MKNIVKKVGLGLMVMGLVVALGLVNIKCFSKIDPPGFLNIKTIIK